MDNNSHSHDLFKGLYGDLEEFADRISTLINGPVTIEDANHRLLAYSTHDDITDRARILTIIGRRVPEKVINSLWKEGVIPALLESNKPVIVPSLADIGLGKRAAVSIRKNDEVLGFIWALETASPFDDQKLSLLSLAAKEAKNQLLHLQSKNKRRVESYQDFFWKLLTGHFSNEKDIANQLLKFPFSIPKMYAILAFQFQTGIQTDVEKQIHYLISTTQKVTIVFHTVNDDTYILLVEASEDHNKEAFQEFIKSFISYMKDRFDVPVLSGGGGRIYSSFMDAHKSYKEALSVIRLKRIYKNDLSDVYLYDYLGIYQYLEILSQQRLDRDSPPIGLTAIKDYDNKHQTELYVTLEAYLDHDSNPNETSKYLHIHNNTLSYRLKRIMDISRYDLKDTNVKSYLFIEMKLAQYNEF